MPSYKLTYFNITGLAEPIRLVLHQSGIKFEDKRLTQDEWPEVKKSKNSISFRKDQAYKSLDI